MIFSDHFLFSYFFNVQSMLHIILNAFFPLHVYFLFSMVHIVEASKKKIGHIVG